MDEDIDVIVQESSGTDHILNLLDIRKSLTEQGMDIPESLEETIQKELIIVAIDTDTVYRSVQSNYKKSLAKETVASVTAIK